jgi:hypothetical protein
VHPLHSLHCRVATGGCEVRAVLPLPEAQGGRVAGANVEVSRWVAEALLDASRARTLRPGSSREQQGAQHGQHRVQAQILARLVALALITAQP